MACRGRRGELPADPRVPTPKICAALKGPFRIATENDVTVDYDPYSDAAMRDPRELYRRMREAGCPHHLPEYGAWALVRYDDVDQASRGEGCIDFSKGALLGQHLLGEPIPHTFMTMNEPERRPWRNILMPFYSRTAIRQEAGRLRALVRELLEPLLAQGSFDVYRDLANRVMCINAGHNLGLPRADAEYLRSLIDEMIMHREPGQKGGSSERNQKAAQELGGYMAAHVNSLRKNPDRAVRQAKALLEAEIDGQRLSDHDLINYFFSLMVTGSETTPMATAGVFYYLGKHPDQKALVVADPAGMAKAAFLETCRFDQPTNMLVRRAAKDFELGGKQIRENDVLLMIYASANRDEARFERAEEFDIRRQRRADLTFGTGPGYCLGANLAEFVGPMMVEEIMTAIGDFELIEDQCERAYGENLAGFNRVPIRFKPPA